MPAAVAEAIRMKPCITKIVGKFQITIPIEIRELYGLKEGDLMEWIFNPKTSELVVSPRRAQLITPLVQKVLAEMNSEEDRKEAGAKKAKV